MNWKFWQWPAQIARQRNELKTLSERLEQMQRRIPALADTEDRQLLNNERLTILAGVRDDDPVWATVLTLVDEHERNERDVLLQPGLTDSQRQFNAGRMASAYDLACVLRDLKAEAERVARKAV